MNSLRPELLELTPQALTALSNAGFVKRSLKELENGNVPEISHENGALIATFSDGVRTQLANSQALKEAQCSCGASGMCRHRVMLVLSYQRLCATVQPTEKEEEWDPAIWLEELATLPDATRKRAQAVRKLANETGWDPSQIALAYLYHQPYPTVPVIGVQSVRDICNVLVAMELPLTPNMICQIAQRGEAQP